MRGPPHMHRGPRDRERRPPPIFDGFDSNLEYEFDASPCHHYAPPFHDSDVEFEFDFDSEMLEDDDTPDPDPDPDAWLLATPPAGVEVLATPDVSARPSGGPPTGLPPAPSPGPPGPRDPTHRHPPHRPPPGRPGPTGMHPPPYRPHGPPPGPRDRMRWEHHRNRVAVGGFPGGGGGGPGMGKPPPPPGSGWGTPYIIALLVLSVLFLALFAAWEVRLERAHPLPSSSSASSTPPLSTANPTSPPTSRLARWTAAARAYTPPPLLRPSLFTRARGRVGVMYAIALLQFGAFMVWAFWVQLYYQSYVGYSPVRTVVRLIPMFVTGLICNVIVAALVGRVPVLWLVASGTAITTLAPLLFALVRPSAPYWAFGFPAAVCSVVGADFVFAAGTLFVAGACAPGEQSVAGGVFQTMTQLGTSLGVTASTIVFNRVQERAMRQGEDALGAYHASMWAGCGFGVLATLLALVFFRGVGTIGHAPPPGAESGRAEEKDDVREQEREGGAV
ncbi:major facilitator superfamily domain-containing protein [Mycena sp. CBHHK59/15]|nr:major facilitator superfamily domain-containing protein [Mycena sp. CBHHK59/15]